jgi:hypothetical protein
MPTFTLTDEETRELKARLAVMEYALRMAGEGGPSDLRQRQADARSAATLRRILGKLEPSAKSSGRMRVVRSKRSP